MNFSSMNQSLESLLKSFSGGNQYNFDKLVDRIRLDRTLRHNYTEMIAELKKSPHSILNSHIQIDENPFQLIYTPTIYSLLFFSEFVKMIRSC